MNTWILELGLGILLFIGLIPLLLLPLIRWVYQRYSRLALWPTAFAAFTALYLSGVAAFVFFPLPALTRGFCDNRALYEYWSPVPFTSIGEAIGALSANGLAQGLRSTAFLQAFFNVVLFVPLGFGLGYLLRKKWWMAGLIGFAGSVLIELTQGTAIFGIYECPYRVAEVDDLILNTVGALAGWMLGWLLTRMWPYRDPVRVDDLGAPSRKRRAGAVLLNLMNLTVMSFILRAAVLLVLAAIIGDISDETRGLVTVLSQLFVLAVALVLVPTLVDPGRTPGYRAVGLVVVNTAMDPASLQQLTARAVLRYGWLLATDTTTIFWFLLLVDLLVAWRRPDNRTLIDLLTGTKVITHQLQQTSNHTLTQALE